MGKVLKLLAMVVALWAGLTVYLEGVEGLKGNVQSFISGDETVGDALVETRSLPQRFGDKVEREMAKREQRVSERLDGI